MRDKKSKHSLYLTHYINSIYLQTYISTSLLVYIIGRWSPLRKVLTSWNTSLPSSHLVTIERRMVIPPLQPVLPFKRGLFPQSPQHTVAPRHRLIVSRTRMVAATSWAVPVAIAIIVDHRFTSLHDVFIMEASGIRPDPPPPLSNVRNVTKWRERRIFNVYKVRENSNPGSLYFQQY